MRKFRWTKKKRKERGTAKKKEGRWGRERKRERRREIGERSCTSKKALDGLISIDLMSASLISPRQERSLTMCKADHMRDTGKRRDEKGIEMSKIEREDRKQINRKFTSGAS